MRAQAFADFAADLPRGGEHAAGRSTATSAVRQHFSLAAASLPADLAAAHVLRWRPFLWFRLSSCA